MSNWNWVNAGLEYAIYRNTQQTAQHLAEMKEAAQIEAARKAFQEALKKFIFDVSRSIQNVEEQTDSAPFQSYIVAKALEMRLINSQVSTDHFPDFQDKEYLLKTQKKTSDAIERSKSYLSQDQIKTAETAAQYVFELPMLKQMIEFRVAQKSFDASKKQHQEFKKKSFIGALVALAILYIYFGSSHLRVGNFISFPACT